jgi:putative hydrolases of HD superfamily
MNFLFDLADVVLRFGAVNRLTEDCRGVPESDSTHTVMLALVCREMLEHCAQGVPYCPCERLDRQAVLEMALVHDLPEAYAGDTQTLRIAPDERAAKDARENEAMAQLQAEFPGSWLKGALIDYAAQATPESRFVRAVDKCLPKLTHILNDCAVLRKQGMGQEEFLQRIGVEQRDAIATYAGEFRCVMDFHAQLVFDVARLLPEQCNPVFLAEEEASNAD